MRRVTRCVSWVLGCLFSAAAFAGDVTFYKDVLPVLQQRCQECHRPGEAAPMSLLTYKDARPWAKAIREAVLTKKMPPWFADPAHGKFANDRSLPESEKRTLAAWADGGALEGNPKDGPKPLEFADGWTIGKPDLVLEVPVDYQVPASGTVDYTYFVVPTGSPRISGSRRSKCGRAIGRWSITSCCSRVRRVRGSWRREIGRAVRPAEARRADAGGHRPGSVLRHERQARR